MTSAHRRIAADRDFSAFDALWLHRAVRETPLARIAGRDAIRADELQMAAAVGAVASAEETVIGDFSALRLARPNGPDVRRHLWVQREGERIARDVSIWDNAALHGGDAVAFDLAARSLGAAHPVHPPLGELRSGRGQLALGAENAHHPLLDDSATDILMRWQQMWDTRSFGGFSGLYAPDACWRGAAGQAGDQRAMITDAVALLASMPDAIRMIERVEAQDDGLAILWRLHGHPAQAAAEMTFPQVRRLRILGSTFLTFKNGRIVTEDMLYDRLAIAAGQYQPIIEY